MNIQILRLFFYILVWQCLYSLSFDIFWEYFIIMLLKKTPCLGRMVFLQHSELGSHTEFSKYVV